jgi:hypothetical protein
MDDPVNKLSALEEALEAMIIDNKHITARGIVRRMQGVFKNATDITRQPLRRALLERYQEKQSTLRSVLEKADKQSKASLSAQIARKDEKLASLKRQCELLIASHKAMILGVGEMGGMKAWRKFYTACPGIIDELRDIDAMSKTEIRQVPLHQGSSRTIKATD